jgi:hypothetical protein
MIRLNLNPQPEWIELLPGVRVQVAPLTTAVVLSVRGALPTTADRDQLALEFNALVAERVILAWEGICDEDGAPMPVSTDAIRHLLGIYPIYMAFERAYVGRWAGLSDEKKGSAPLPSGTSAGAPTTAELVTASAPTARAN